MKLKIILMLIMLSSQVVHSSTNLIDENKIFKNLRCLICQGQSVADSNSEFAQTIKLVVKDQIKDGKSEREIYSFLREKYGDWILYDPPFNKSNYLLWILPYSALIVGGIIILSLVKKRKTKG